MPGKISPFAIGVLFASVALGQGADRLVTLTHTDIRGLQQIASIVRTIADTQNVSVDEANQTIAVHGTAGQAALAAWLCAELDRLPGGMSGSVRHDYPETVAGADKVQISYLAHVPAAAALQEMLNLTRAVGEIQRASGYPQLNAVVLRASPERMALADWLIGELDRPDAPAAQTPHDYRAAFDARADTAQVIFLANTANPQALQEIINATRSVSDVQRVFPYNSLKALSLRGSAEQIALADWVIRELDKPASQAPDADPHEYQVPAAVAGGAVARVFYLSSIQAPYLLQEVVNAVRSEANVQRAYPVHQLNAITVRGSNDQIARAEQIIRARDR
ncbi:MAG TPA: hypothetical protein VMH28_22200 [Candidatus Acidoferrales bacterium]|nr:hypothetical protein [Candidatus Acidoferrales bacterium]